jgi:SAM-dependent methyltransferase
MPEPKSLVIPQELLILGAAVDTGILNSLKENLFTHQEMATKLGLDTRAVWTVVEAMSALGYVRHEGDKVTLSEKAKHMFYDAESTEYMGFAFMHRYHLVQKWIQLPEIIKTGKPYQGIQDSKHTQYFIEAMSYNAQQSAQPIAQFLFKEYKLGMTLIDIGGGPLAHAKEFSKLGAKVSILDTPEVVEMNQKEASEFGITMIPGDFLGTLPEGPFDIAYLGNICHIIGEKENQDLFVKVGKILSPKGRIVIVDFIRGTNPGAALFAVNMLVNTDTGGTYTFDQYTEWLESAGFENVHLDIIVERQVITATKK